MSWAIWVGNDRGKPRGCSYAPVKAYRGFDGWLSALSACFRGDVDLAVSKMSGLVLGAVEMLSPWPPAGSVEIG